MQFKKAIAALAVAAGVGLTGSASAESAIDIGAAAGSRSASARVDFQIVIPEFLFFRVGSAGATIDLVNFDLSGLANPETDLGSGVAFGAASGGDVSPGVLSVRVLANAGQVTITENNGGALTNGAGGTISYSELLTASNDTDLPAPTLSDGGGNTAQPTLSSSRVTNRSAQWTYTYANNNLPDAGTYGGVNTNNGRVTYVASAP